MQEDELKRGLAGRRCRGIACLRLGCAGEEPRQNDVWDARVLPEQGLHALTLGLHALNMLFLTSTAEVA